MRAIREYAGLSQGELAELADTSWATIMRFEKEKHSIHMDRFMRICAGLSRYVNAPPEIIACIILGGSPLYAIVKNA